MVKLHLPDGDYIQVPENYSSLDLLAEVCVLERRKLDRLIEEQVIENVPQRSRTPRIPYGLISEPPRASSSSEDKGEGLRVAATMMPRTLPPAWEDDANSPDSVLDSNNPNSVLHSNKRTRPWETSDHNSTNHQETLLVAKKKKELKNKKIEHHQGPNPPPDMPAAFRKKIIQLEGLDAIIYEENLLIQKTLTLSDVAKNQNRLSIPMKKLGDVKFLTDDEKRLLSSHDGTNVGSLDDVMIIEPSLKTSQVSFRMWEMRKPNGNNSISYVITKTWNGIKERNHLEEGMIVQVWAIRVGEKLWLALVKLP